MIRLFAVLVAAAVVVTLWRRLASIRSSPDIGEIDHETLSEAESELDNLSAFSTPDDAQEEIPDWGPGTPR